MPGIFYVARHGIAEPGAGKVDDERVLTPEGIRGMERAAQGLKALGTPADLVASSSLQRAVQTATILRDTLAPHVTLQTLASLNPGHHPAAVLNDMGSMAGKRVFLVGHLPDIAGLVALCITGQSGSGFAFEPGTIARIDFQGSVRAGGGTLRWLMKSEIMQQIG